MKTGKRIFIMLLVIALAFVGTILVSVEAFAEESSFTIEISTDKGSYKATDVAKINVKVTNTSNAVIENVSVEALFDGLSPVGKDNTLKAEANKLNVGESLLFSYSTMINSNYSGLNIFQKIVLFFKKLFNRTVSVGDNGFDNGRAYTQAEETISFGRFDTKNTIRVWYTNNSDTTIPNITSKDYKELIKGVDIDGSCEYEEDNIVFDDERGLTYVNNVIILMFDDDCSIEERACAINSVDGEVVGGREIVDTLYIRVKNYTLSELESLCDQLSESYKLDAFVETSITEDSCANVVAPNDTYLIESNGVNASYFNGLELSWNNNKITNTGYRNWYHLAIQTPAAWEYNDFFDTVNIGIVDNGFDTSHDDLDIQIVSKKNRSKNHGTHVAGIIGATQNNGKGATGIVWNKNLFGYSYSSSTSNLFRSDFFRGLEELVNKNCKVINFSQGFSQGLENSDRVYLDYTINHWGKEASKEIYKLLSKGKDFIVVQSAGNGAGDNKGIDALQNGLFASVTKKNCYSKGSISADSVLNRIIVVANANLLNGEYQLSKDSNGGSQVAIAAPGMYIYNTVAGEYEKDASGSVRVNDNQKYAQLSGTSMAAPMVTGVAGLVWSVDSSFTGDQVRDIIISSAQDGKAFVKKNNDSATSAGFPLLNAKLAVEEALRQSGSFFAGGNGTKENPYKVETAEQLNMVRDFPTSSFIQIEDIDLSEYENWEPIGYGITSYSTTLLHPVNLEEKIFNGSYDGNGYSINNLSIKETNNNPFSDCYGLFGVVEKATLKNITLNNIEIVIDRNDVDYEYLYKSEGNTPSVNAGGIVGYAKQNTTISDCCTSGSISVENCNDANVGGVSGYGDPSYCRNYVSVSVYANRSSRYETDSTVCCGGVTGRTRAVYSPISNNTNYGNVSASGGNWIQIGGICGDYGVFSNCVNLGTISGQVLYGQGTGGHNRNIGGVAGYTANDAENRDCVNYGDVFVVYNCYKQPTNKPIIVGGVFGQGKSSKNCYNLCRHITIETSMIDPYKPDYLASCQWSRVFYNYQGNDSMYNYSINSTEIKLDGLTRCNAGYRTGDKITDNSGGGMNIYEENLLNEETYREFDFTNTWIIDETIGGPILR